MKNKENGGEGVCLPQIQAIDYDSFFRLQVILPHSPPHIKIRVTEASFLPALDFVEGGGAAGRRGLRLKGPVYLIGWRRRLHVF
jgi:hypothetical protein